jgi:hypothetical protein
MNQLILKSMQNNNIRRQLIWQQDPPQLQGNDLNLNMSSMFDRFTRFTDDQTWHPPRIIVDRYRNLNDNNIWDTTANINGSNHLGTTNTQHTTYNNNSILSLRSTNSSHSTTSSDSTNSSDSSNNIFSVYDSSHSTNSSLSVSTTNSSDSNNSIVSTNSANSNNSILSSDSANSIDSVNSNDSLVTLDSYLSSLSHNTSLYSYDELATMDEFEYRDFRIELEIRDDYLEVRRYLEETIDMYHEVGNQILTALETQANNPALIESLNDLYFVMDCFTN